MAVHPTLIDPAARAAAQDLAPADLADLVGYWARGAGIVQACLAKAEKADFLDAPVGLDADQAKLWHSARADAFRHALEMMGPFEGCGVEAKLAA